MQNSLGLGWIELLGDEVLDEAKLAREQFVVLVASFDRSDVFSFRKGS
jgi:hypothetical protein